MGRRTISLSAGQKREVETLAAVLNSDQIADYFGISRRTFFAIVARDPEIAALYKKGKAKAIGSIAQSLITKARNGDTTAMIFYLKTQAGWREQIAVEHLEPEAPADTTSSASRRVLAALDAIAARINPAEATLEHVHDAAGDAHQRTALPAPRMPR